jgi:hypothetical protein
MRYILRVVCLAILVAFALSHCIAGMASAGHEETMMGAVIKRGNDFVIETEDGDYVVEGKDLSKFIGKFVLVTGIVTESQKRNLIEIKTIEDIQTIEDD